MSIRKIIRFQKTIKTTRKCNIWGSSSREWAGSSRVGGRVLGIGRKPRTFMARRAPNHPIWEPTLWTRSCRSRSSIRSKLWSPINSFMTRKRSTRWSFWTVRIWICRRSSKSILPPKNSKMIPSKTQVALKSVAPLNSNRTSSSLKWKIYKISSKRSNNSLKGKSSKSTSGKRRPAMAPFRVIFTSTFPPSLCTIEWKISALSTFRPCSLHSTLNRTPISSTGLPKSSRSKIGSSTRSSARGLRRSKPKAVKMQSLDMCTSTMTRTGR